MKYAANAQKSVVIQNLIGVLILFASYTVRANGVVDIGVEREEKQIQALIRTKNDIFMSYNSVTNSVGLAYGVHFDGGFVLAGASDESINLSVFYRPPKTEVGIDFGLIDSVDDTRVKFKFGFSYYVGDNFAIQTKTDFDVVWLGVRRWL